MCVLSASGRLNLTFPAAHLQWRAGSGGGVARAFPRAICTPRPSTPLGDYPVPWADTVYTACFRTVGPPGRPGTAGRSGGRGADPSVALGGRDCQVSRDLRASQERQLERARCAPPQPGEEREPGGRRAGGCCYVNDTGPVRGLQAGAAGGGGGAARGGGAERERERERERAGVGGGRGPGRSDQAVAASLPG